MLKCHHFWRVYAFISWVLVIVFLFSSRPTIALLFGTTNWTPYLIGVFFQSIVRDCIARNENRENAVPRQAIPCTQNKLQLPSYSEGFDKLYFARITDNGFEITDWKE